MSFLRSLSIFWALFILFFASDMYAGGKNYALEDSAILQDSIHAELSAKEWKKFKYFEEKLQSSALSKKEKQHQLTGYTRDSLQILRVKLVAIKVLNEKNLLNKDIAENAEYYIDLLRKFKESNIPPAEYLFLEEKLAYLNQEALGQQLRQSRWLNFGLIALVLMLVLVFYQVRKQRKPILPELSKQETLVRNLILEGKSNKEIANELFISLSTVKSHITNIYGKLNVGNRQELLQNSTGTST
ncbi:helix-turn-helix transcriptional regulator [Muricauda sp. MAR_2010_75]|uniref:helix-turn-helix domain-containing protein n=1 Tax=Allomuricauda sp. MAR_2010_75 TaxID=1250232 RepID=UPI0009DED1B4|nr:helix-turn-helix transcriptional regulator [Muricauda sp. MAR_2010_75]